MADFLTRLVSRTLGLAPLAEPLVAAMFAADPPPATMTDADEPLAARPASDERADLSRPRPEPPEVGPASPRMAAAAPDDADRDDAPPRRRRSTPAADDALPTPTVAAGCGRPATQPPSLPASSRGGSLAMVNQKCSTLLITSVKSSSPSGFLR